MNKPSAFLQKSVRTSDENVLMYAIMIGLEVVEGRRSENTGEKVCPLGPECAGENLPQATIVVQDLSHVSKVQIESWKAKVHLYVLHNLLGELFYVAGCTFVKLDCDLPL